MYLYGAWETSYFEVLFGVSLVAHMILSFWGFSSFLLFGVNKSKLREYLYGVWESSWLFFSFVFCYQQFFWLRLCYFQTSVFSFIACIFIFIYFFNEDWKYLSRGLCQNICFITSFHWVKNIVICFVFLIPSFLFVLVFFMRNLQPMWF